MVSDDKKTAKTHFLYRPPTYLENRVSKQWSYFIMFCVIFDSSKIWKKARFCSGSRFQRYWGIYGAFRAFKSPAAGAFSRPWSSQMKRYFQNLKTMWKVGLIAKKWDQLRHPLLVKFCQILQKFGREREVYKSYMTSTDVYMSSRGQYAVKLRDILKKSRQCKRCDCKL